MTAKSCRRQNVRMRDLQQMGVYGIAEEMPMIGTKKKIVLEANRVIFAAVTLERVTLVNND